ncbi:MAG: AP2 domain-containing protein [Phycisphaerae bacterium]|jgi:hypothetical protein
MNDSNVCRIALTQGYFAIVDADDYEQLNKYKWHVRVDRTPTSRGYAYRSEGKTKIAMHRQILNAPQQLYCDHINHDGLDNRRANLRLCTPQQNACNRKPLERTSKYKGVYRSRGNKKWRAEIRNNGRKIHIGYYYYEKDAAIAYDDWAIELFGEFAYLNFPYRPEIEHWLAQTRLFACR